MSVKLSDKEYNTLEAYVSSVLKRYREDKISEVSAREAMMHPLTALLEGSQSEFIPYMRLRLEQWDKQ